MDQPRSKITRQDREVADSDWIIDLLCRVPVGTLATSYGNQPFQSTLLFVFDKNRHAIYLHTARRGRVWENLHANPRSCFTAAEMGRFLPASTALNFSVEYNSVVVFGNARLVDNGQENEQALQITLDKYFPHLRPERDYRPITQSELDVTAVFRIDIEEWSGKRKAAPPDFPGAFWYPSSR